MSEPSPRIIAFFCHWCAYEAADGAGRARIDFPAGVDAVRVMCSGRVAPGHILTALENGADGVLVVGCPLGDCHYKSGNREALKRVALVQETLAAMGIARDRVRVEWAGAGEAERLAAVVNDMSARLKRLASEKAS